MAMVDSKDTIIMLEKKGQGLFPILFNWIVADLIQLAPNAPDCPKLAQIGPIWSQLAPKSLY